jgi:hypothetical protein
VNRAHSEAPVGGEDTDGRQGQPESTL